MHFDLFLGDFFVLDIITDSMRFWNILALSEHSDGKLKRRHASGAKLHYMRAASEHTNGPHVRGIIQQTGSHAPHAGWKLEEPESTTCGPHVRQQTGRM